MSAAAMGGMIDNRAAADIQALLRPVLEHDALAAEPGSLLATLATLQLILDDELTTAFALCEALIDVARPRGWLIALAHGCMMRAMALVRAGEIRQAEADGRLAFEYKLPIAPAPAMLWCLAFLLDALVEADDLTGADAALTAAGQQGVPPAARSARRWCCRAAPGSGWPSTGPPMRWPTPGWPPNGPGKSASATRCSPAGAPRPPKRSSSSVRTPRPGGWRWNSSSSVSSSGRRAPAAPPCACSPARRPSRSRCWSRRSRCWPARGPGSSTPAPWSPSAPRCAGRTGGRTPATRSGARWSRRIAAACCGWPGVRGRSSNAVGARPRRSALSGPGALTPAEHRVAELAARGHGNRAIAERLYVTPRTVETHLTHAFAKLDIRSRTELAAALQPAPADSGTLTVT